MLPIVKQIVQKVTFPGITLTGNSADVMGKKIGGDADDFITATYGIPSITAELGDGSLFYQQWVAQTKENAYGIVLSNFSWLSYIFTDLPDFS